MTRGQRMPNPKEAIVFEASYGAPVEVQWMLTRENETSFWDTTLSVDFVLDTTSKLAGFLLLHPWFCQHVVFVWKTIKPPFTCNLLLTSFKCVTIEKDKTVIVGVRPKAIDSLQACEIIEESRRTMEQYDGTGVNKLKEEHDARAKRYFDSGLIPRLEI